MSVALELKDIQKRFGLETAVDGLSIALQHGQFLSLLGPSGCGKSTTLGMIAGFLEPDAGEIWVGGKRINGVPPQSRGVGLVFQDYAVFTALTVRENLAFGLAVKGVSRAARKEVVRSFAAKLDLLPLLDKRGGALNMSEMQRVAMARVLITEPSLLLLDEPMSNLDAAIRGSLRGELKQLQKAHQQTVLYVTHDQIEALSMSDKIAVMRDGRLLQIGSPEEIYQNPKTRFVAEFIGDPPINIVACEVQKTGTGLKLATCAHALGFTQAPALDPGQHYIGVRPNDVLVSKTPRRGYVPAPIRFIENMGVEHVLYLEYGPELLRAVVDPGFASVGETTYVAFDLGRIHVIERTTDMVVACEMPEYV